jgi:membrane-bound lytic murein transglycosylase D
MTARPNNYHIYQILCMILAAVIVVSTSACSTTSFHSNKSGWNVIGKTAKRSSRKARVRLAGEKIQIEKSEKAEISDLTNSPSASATELSSPKERSDVSLKPIPALSRKRKIADLPPAPSEKEFSADASPSTALHDVPAFGVAAADKTVTRAKTRAPNEAHLIFDFPVTYNARVRKWIKYFQTTGRPSFRRWLERSSRYIPGIQEEMKRANLPLDLAYVAMIESGFSSSASSHANALGMWQFIAPTGTRYGLSIDWWIDERRDFEKATKAAIGYMSDLYEQFGSWHLVAASYNMGENGVRRLIKRYKTNSFWDLADRGALPEETRNYLPKMLAAMLIAKAPALYGFRDLEFQVPYSFDTLEVPGGTDLINLADHLGVSERSLTELNPELLKAFVPREVKTHRIRIPKGSKIAVSQFVNPTGRSLQ